MDDLGVFILIIIVGFLGFIIGFSSSEKRYTYIDFNDNVGQTDYCFQEYDKKVCKIDTTYIIVKDYKD